MTRSKADALLNSKYEIHQKPNGRVVAASGLHGELGENQEVAIFPRAGGPGRGRGRARGQHGARIGRRKRG